MMSLNDIREKLKKVYKMSMNDNESENKDKVIDISQYVHEKSKKRKSKEQIKDILYPKITEEDSDDPGPVAI